MFAMTTAKIIKNVEKLDHHERWKYMIALGKKSQKDLALAQMLAKLVASPVQYERMLALMSAHGSHNTQMIIQAVEDVSHVYMSAAIRLAAQHLDEGMLAQLLPRLSKLRRLALFRALLKARRVEVNDHLYRLLGVQEQRKLLPYVSEKLVKTYFNDHAIEELDTSQWRHLAQRFPALVQTLLCAALEQPQEPSWLVQSAVQTALRALYAFAPKAGLTLLEKAAARMNMQNLHLALYAPFAPDGIGKLALAYTGRLSIAMPINTLKRLDGETLCALVQKNVLVNLAAVYPKLLPEQRAALYENHRETWRTSEGALPLTYVKALPTSARKREALHAFNLPLLESQPMQRLPYLACLPFAQALPLAERYLSQPEGELRALAVGALVESERYDAAQLDGVLDFCLMRENEQDPVRLTMMQALASLPPTHWQVAHLPKLKSIIDAALRARDCSHMTMLAAAQVLLGMIVPQTSFVTAELPHLVERMGSLYMPSQESRMTDAQMVALAPRLLPLLRSWIGRDRAQLALGVIFGFGKRAKAVPAFAEIMATLTNDKRGHVARLGLDGLRRMEFFKEAAKLIPQLIKEDGSWIQVNEVAQYLHLHRQSLLTPFLEARQYRGRFGSGYTRVLIGFDGGFARWTHQQQRLYAKALQGIIHTDQRNAWELYQTVSRLSALPSIDIAPLIQLAQLDTKDAALRDKALEALGRTDAGRGIPTLLEALDDARARVAIYALRRSLLNMPAPQALALLSTVNSHKVTVLKEAIRLVGEFEGEEAYALLNRYVVTENMHPDVHIALLRAFWGHLQHDAVWEYLHAAASSPRAALARATIRIPQEGLSAKGRQHLSQQLTLLLQHPDAQVRRETLERLVAMPLGQPDATLRAALTPLLEDADRRTCQMAAAAMLVAYGPLEDMALVQDFAQVGQAQQLVAVVAAYEQHRFYSVQDLTWSAQNLVDALLVRRWQLAQAVHLALVLLPPAKSLAYILRVEKSALLHPGVVAYVKWDLVVTAHAQEELAWLEAQMRSANSVELRHMGLDLLCALAQQYGWVDGYRQLLTQYCADRALWVSDVAELIGLPEPLVETQSIVADE